jgi:hypothetical protein
MVTAAAGNESANTSSTATQSTDFAKSLAYKMIRNEYDSVKARLISEKKEYNSGACMAEIKKMHPDWPDSEIAAACKDEVAKAEEGKEAVGYTVSGTATNSIPATPAIVTPAQLKKLNHTFKWPLPVDLKGKKPRDFMLIKGAAMSEGSAKRGEHMTKENLMHGAGAMSAFALLGLSQIDIDHFATALPETYEAEFPGISKPYPVGVMIDAAVDKNMVDGKEVHQVEFIAFLTNPKVYEMVEQGKFIGTSVVDMFRKENCSCGADQAEHTCNKCSIEGSHFIHNTLVLKGVPNSNGTWVAPVTEEDLGTIITNMGTEDIKQNSSTPAIGTKIQLLERAHMIMKQHDDAMNACVAEAVKAGKSQDEAVAYCSNKAKAPAEKAPEEKANMVEGTPVVIQGNIKDEKELIAVVDKHLTEQLRSRGLVSHTTHTITEFYDDGSNAVVMDTPEKITAAESFLAEKGLTPEMAHSIALHLKANPKALSKHQLERASAADLSAWYGHLRLNAMESVIESNERLISLITKIRPHKESVTFDEALKMVADYNEHTVKKPLLTKAEAKYAVQHSDAASACKSCKWYMQNSANPASDTGFCSRVEGRINVVGHCGCFETVDAPVKVEPAKNAEPAKPVEATTPTLDAVKEKLNEAKEDPAKKVAEAATAGAAVATEHAIADVASSTVNTPAGAVPPTAIIEPRKIKVYSVQEVSQSIMSIDEIKSAFEKVDRMTPMGGRTTSMNNYTQLLKTTKEIAKKSLDSHKAMHAELERLHAENERLKKTQK